MGNQGIPNTDYTDTTDKKDETGSVSSLGIITEAVLSFSALARRWFVQQPPVTGMLQHQGVFEYLEVTILRWFCQLTLWRR